MQYGFYVFTMLLCTEGFIREFCCIDAVIIPKLRKYTDSYRKFAAGNCKICQPLVAFRQQKEKQLLEIT